MPFKNTLRSVYDAINSSSFKIKLYFMQLIALPYLYLDQMLNSLGENLFIGDWRVHN